MFPILCKVDAAEGLDKGKLLWYTFPNRISSGQGVIPDRR